MTITTLRPSSDSSKSGVSFSAGTAMFSLVDDSPDDDTSYIYAATGLVPTSWAIMETPNTLSVSATQKIKQIRWRCRVRAHAATSGYSATVNIACRSNIDGKQDFLEAFSTASTTVQAKTGVWRTKPPSSLGTAWTATNIQNVQSYNNWKASASSHVNLRLTELYLDVDIRDQPVVSGVTVTGYDTSVYPTIAWTYTPNADGDPQTSWRVKIFSAAQYGAAGFSADTSPATWDSGIVSGSASSTTSTGALVAGSTYKAYVEASQDMNGTPWFSAWALSAAFTLTSVNLPVPTLTVTTDNTVPNLRNVLVAQANLNLLSQDNSSFETTIGGWTALANSTVVRSTTQAAAGVASMRMTATAGADMTANTAAGSSGFRVKASTQYTMLGSFRASTTGRTCSVGLAFYDRAGTIIGAMTFGSGVADTNAGFTQSTYTVTSPSNAVYARAAVKVAAAGAAEIHYVDKVDVHTGAGTTWSPGGYVTGTDVAPFASVFIERAWATISPRNLIPWTLWGGGDGFQQNASGAYVTGANSTVFYDRSDRYHGEGCLHWDVNDAASVLYFGSPSVSTVDLSPAYAIAAVPGKTYTFGMYARAGATFSSVITLQAMDRDQNAVGSPATAAISITTSWSLKQCTITVPAGAVYMRVALANTGAVTEQDVFIDAMQWIVAATADTVPAPAMGEPLVWQPVRSCDIGQLLPTSDPGDLMVYEFDSEAPPGYTIIYRARNVVPATDTVAALSSDVTPYFSTMIDPPGPGIWILRDPVSQTNSVRARVVALVENQHEEAGTFYPLRPVTWQEFSQRPVVVSDFVGGHDGTITLICDSEDEWFMLRQLLHTPRSLWLIFPDFRAAWIRIREPSWPRESPRTGSGRDSVWRRTVSAPYLETDGPV